MSAEKKPVVVSGEMPAVVKSPVALREEEILKFWQDQQIFEKSVAKPFKKDYVFYDGPPFATGLPHYGHLLASTIKDVIPRFKTMQGFRVERKWGWDCHGLPVENIVEKELNLKSRKDILDFGLKEFNEKARASVLTYVDDWQKIIPRLGRFVDMKNSYKTMDSNFTESVWHIFKGLSDKGLVYEGFKSMHLCPRCETTLSNFEVTQGYKDITDISVIAKFESIKNPGTYFLAWTTTPWTLPGNVALAVKSDIDYVKIKTETGVYILAEARLSAIKEKFEILEKMKGETLVGESYKPLFPYYNNEKTENLANGYKIYAADFVTTEDGTGIVHIAPAFGEDDLKLGQANNLPFIQHVGTDGRFKKEVTDFAGEMVKPREDHQKADIEIIKHLAGKNLLFAKEKMVHSYPHCWRCETPLLNYATSSWFVAVTKFRDDLIRANQKITWVPADIRDGRFGKWLEGARDWAISRSRFWGAPLPVWRCSGCGEIETIGSVSELKAKTPARNQYFVVRHGEAESNALGIISSNPNNKHHLTEKGKAQAKAAVEKLRAQGITKIISSPFLRTKETAEIIADGLDFKKNKIVYDNRLHEVFVGELDGKTDAEYQAYFGSREEKFYKVPKGGESHQDVKKRMTSVVYDLEKENKGEKILLVSHNTPIWLLFAGVAGMLPKEAIEMRHKKQAFIENSEVKELVFSKIPHNDNFELDLHRPYIDEVKWSCPCGGDFKRVPEVFDCWFESGSMPYAQFHYPFENLDKFNPKPNLWQKLTKGNVGFPAEFIGEGIDQTRGWFYSMLVIAVGLFGQSSYKRVIVNGIVQAEDGQKMSKRLKNYPDPLLVTDKYGADSLRYYFLSSSGMKAEDVRFSEKGVDEVMKKNVGRLNNVYSFFEMYRPLDKTTGERPKQLDNVLDQWIVNRLDETILKITESLEKYELDRATWPIADFIDDLSTWYLRRSRERFKGENDLDGKQALTTTHFVLKDFVKVLAPFMPFVSESLYQKLRLETDPESVHLEVWPEVKKLNAVAEKKLADMVEGRKTVSFGLEARAKAGIKVRQPLAKISLKSKVLEGKKEILALIAEEVNVKEIVFISEQGENLVLDTVITPSLKEEGRVRDFLRALQDWRKASGFKAGEIIRVAFEVMAEGEEFLNDHEAEIKKTTLISAWEVKKVAETATTITLENLSLKVAKL